MKVIELIADVLKREGVTILSCYPTTAVIEVAAAAGIRPIVCRQERVGVGIADGYSRVSAGRQTGVFAMQWGPGAENAFPGVASAYSDSVPILVLPLGHPREMMHIFPHFSSLKVYAPVTKSVEVLDAPGKTIGVMRRAFNALRMGRPGPVMVEIPGDVALEEAGGPAEGYVPVKPSVSMGAPHDVEAAVKTLFAARNPVIQAGQGVLYAQASSELVELAELAQIPVTTTLEGKSAFPEDHPLSLGTGAIVMSGPARHFLNKADVVFGVGSSFTRHPMAANVLGGKTLIHATNDSRDMNKDYPAKNTILGDAKLVLRQFIDAYKALAAGKKNESRAGVAAEIAREKATWLAEWMPKLTSNERPMTPYRVIWEFMQAVDPKDAVVTHDSGSPRDQILPFYQASAPNGYIGWGKSHALGTGLGLTIGAKLAAPDKLCVNFMGDAAFGMTGLDFETAVRCGIPILTIVLNNSTMAVETEHLAISHELFGTRDVGGNYADMARAMGGYAERIDDPNEIRAAILRARDATERGKAALLEFITSEEIAFSNRLREMRTLER